MLRKGRGLDKLLGAPSPGKEVQLSTIPSNISFYGVVRSRGSTGERHIVRKLSEELLKQKKIVFVCYQCISEDERDLPVPIRGLIDINILKGSQGGAVNLDWLNNKEVNKLFLAIKEIKDCAVIFTIGTDSGMKFKERTEQLIQLCKRVYITANDDDKSVVPAKGLLNHTTIDFSNVEFCWWHRIQSCGEPDSYVFGKFSAETMRKKSKKNLNLMAKKNSALQKECSLL